MTWRVGRKIGRTIYLQLGKEPSDDDQLIGVMDTPDLAWEAVVGHNFRTGIGSSMWRAFTNDEED